MEQRSPEWFAARAGKFTASAMADLMARTRSGPAASRANLIARLAVERITEQCVDGFTNAAMQRGIDLEPEALMVYEDYVGSLVLPAAFIVHPDIPYVGASPDGLVDEEGLVEIKCPAAMAKHVDALRNGAHALEYRWQVQCQMWVTGRKWCDVVSYDPRFPEGLKLAVTRVERSESDISEMFVAVDLAEKEVNEVVSQLLKLRSET